MIKYIIHSQRGLGLMEFLGALPIALVLLTSALTSYREIELSMQRSNSSQQLVLDLRRARAEALRIGARSIVSPRADSAGYSVGVDYPPYSEDATSDEVILTHDLPRFITSAFSETLIFDSRGSLITADNEINEASVSLSQNQSQFYMLTISGAGAIEYQHAN